MSGKPFRMDSPSRGVDDQVDTTLTAKAADKENRDRPFFLYFTPCAPRPCDSGSKVSRHEPGWDLWRLHSERMRVRTDSGSTRSAKLSDKTLVIFTSDSSAGAI